MKHLYNFLSALAVIVIISFFIGVADALALLADKFL